MKDLVDLRDVHHQVFGNGGERLGRAHPHGDVPREIFPQEFDVVDPLCILANQSMKPIDILVDGGLGVVLEQYPSPTDSLRGIDEHPLSFNVPFFLCLLGDLVLVVQDKLLLRRILLAVRVDRVETGPNSLCHDLPQRCRGVELGGMMFVVHACEYLFGAKQELLWENSAYPVKSDRVVVFDQLRAHSRWQSFGDIVLIGLGRRCRL